MTTPVASRLPGERSAAAHAGRARGFTLIEVVVTLAIVGILSALAFGSFKYLKQGASFSGATGAFVGAIAQTRAEALGRGVTSVLVVDADGGRWWGLRDVGDDFSLDDFDPSTGAVLPDVLVTSGALPSGVTFGPAAGWGAALAPPFQMFPATPALGATLAACSFCRASGKNTHFGAVTFRPGDEVVFGASAENDRYGGVVTLHDATTGHTTAVAIVSRTGAVQTFTP